MLRAPQPDVSEAAARQGAATVEFAICLPLIVIITFGAIETANGVYLKQVLTQVAYEGARTATSPGGTQAQAETLCNEILAARGIEGAAVRFEPGIDAWTPAGTEVAVTVTAPASSNAIGPTWYFRNRSLQSRVVMVRN